MPQTLTRNLYFTLVHPCINYCNLIWASPHKSTQLDRIMRIQKKYCRLITFSKYDAHSRPLFVRLSILNVYEVHKYQLLSHIFCITDNLINNVYSQQYYKLNSDVHQYNTRQRNNLNIQLTHSSFELQIVNIGLKSRDIVLANIYRPPSSSKPLFFEEFGLLLTNLGTDAVDRLLICGDFNLPGTSPDKIDSGLAELLESTSFTQFVNSPTRHDSHHLTSFLLDLIITPSPSNLVSATSVVSSHEISDHDLALANLNTKRLKSPQRTYQYRNIKDIDLQSFQHNILSSSLVSDPDPTVDGYADQMESVITSALDRAAPLKTGRRSGPRKAKKLAFTRRH